MSAILKTWPAFMPPKKVLQVFTHDWGNFYFSSAEASRSGPSSRYGSRTADGSSAIS